MVLQTLCRQSAAPTDHEIIVVDNNSSDGTRNVAEAIGRRHPHVRYCPEPRQGLSHARNRGWRQARGRYVAYVDDDSQVTDSWVATAADVIRRVGPAVFGGPYSALYASPKPRWFRDAYGSSMKGDEARALTRHEFLDGSNLVIRRSLLERLGGFDCGLGMAGSKLAYGEETELQRRIRAAVPEAVIYYEPALHVYHLVRAEKMTIRWMARRHFVSGRSVYHVFGGAPGCAGGRWVLWKQAVRTLGALSADLVRAVLRRDRTRFPYVQNYLCERVFPHLQRLGRIHEQYRDTLRIAATP
jgi:glycosyltransferase involved in cell wall biosynthesis